MRRLRRLKLQHWQQIAIYLAVYDVIAVSLSYLLALLFRFDFSFSHIPAQYFDPWLRFAPVYAALCLAVFWLCRLYNSIWRFASFKELQRITLATVISCGLHAVLISLIFGRMPLSYYFGGPLIQYALTIVIRFSYRFIQLIRSSRDKKYSSRVATIGAGAAGQTLARDVSRTKGVLCAVR